MSADGAKRGLIRVFAGTRLSNGPLCSLDEDTTHYVSRVLRGVPGQKLELFDAGGMCVVAVIESVPRGQGVTVRYEGDPWQASKSVGPRIHVACSLPKGGKLDEVIRRCCELGAESFLPVFSQYSVPRGVQEDKRLTRWRRIAGEAARQSGRIPMQVEGISLVGDLLKRCTGEVLVLWVGESTVSLSQCCAMGEAPEDVTLFVGPEGGWSADEIKAFQDCGARTVSLGPRVLRAETAPVAALAIVQSQWGDM